MADLVAKKMVHPIKSSAYYSPFCDFLIARPIEIYTLEKKAGALRPPNPTVWQPMGLPDSESRETDSGKFSSSRCSTKTLKTCSSSSDSSKVANLVEFMVRISPSIWSISLHPPCKPCTTPVHLEVALRFDFFKYSPH